MIGQPCHHSVLPFLAQATLSLYTPVVSQVLASPSFTTTRAFDPGWMLYFGSNLSMSFHFSSGTSAFFAASSLHNEHLALAHIALQICLRLEFMRSLDTHACTSLPSGVERRV